MTLFVGADDCAAQLARMGADCNFRAAGLAAADVALLTELLPSVAPHLTSLNLSHNKLSAELGSCALWESLRGLSQLTRLDLRNNFVGRYDFTCSKQLFRCSSPVPAILVWLIYPSSG
jgi:hypothetical protein